MNSLKKYWLGFFLLALVGSGAFLIYKKLHPKTLPPNLIEAVGRFDADIIHLNTKYPARIKIQNAQDSMPIKKGQILTKLDSKEFEAKKAAIAAEIEAKSYELKVAKESLPQNIIKAKAALKSSLASKKEILSNIEALESVLNQDRKDYKRLLSLYNQQLIQKHKVELAKLKLKTDLEKLKALKAKLLKIQAAIQTAKSTIAQAKSQLNRIEALNYEIKALQAKEKEINSIILELTLRSPIDGFVLEKIANIGEVLGAGATSATLLDPKSLYLRVYIDTINVGKIKLLDKAVIFLDAYPNRPFKAKVVRVAKKAEFTPKEVAIRSDRIQRVYAVDIKPIKTNPLFKVGLPATAVISLDGKGLPNSLEEIPKL